MIKDYAMPTMMAEKALKDLHNAFLAGDMGLARLKAIEAARHCMEIWEVLKDESEGAARS